MTKIEFYHKKIKDINKAYRCWQFRNYISCSEMCEICPFKHSYLGLNKKIDMERLINDSQKIFQFIGQISEPIVELDKDEKRKK